MSRTPKPWYRKDRKAWFVTIDGQRHNLGRDRKEAFRRFHELMTEPQKRAVASTSLPAIFDAFLEWCQLHRAADTYEWYRYRLERFAQRYPDLTSNTLKPFHVQQWVDSFDLSKGSKRNYTQAVKRCLRWAKRQGYIDVNPIADLEVPRAGRRELVLSDAEFQAILEITPDEDFKDLLITTWETGCRRQESLRVESRHVDLENQRWVFSVSESKTNIPRIVYLTDRALEITKRRMSSHPQGALFRNNNGKPWKTSAVNCAFCQLQIRRGKRVMAEQGLAVSQEEIDELIPTLATHLVDRGKERAKRLAELRHEAKKKLTQKLATSLSTKYSLYTLRHSWMNRLLKRGVDALTVAFLAGHSDPSKLAKVYAHLSQDPTYLLNQAKKGNG